MFFDDLAHRELAVINDIIDDTAKRLKKYGRLPKMTLVFRVRGIERIDYYGQEMQNGKKVLHPMGKADNKTVIAYKHKRYLQEKLKILEKNAKALKKLLSSYSDYSPEAIESILPAGYKDLPTNSYEDEGLIEIPEKYKRLPENIYNDPRFQDLVKWASQKYKRNPAPLPENPNISRDGTPMRSKGECMWYDDILFDGLPCWVDPEIKIKGKSGQWHILHPDFVFKCFDGSYIIVEHFGDWGDDEYAEKNKLKIQVYLDCGYVIGDNLVVTSDNAEHRTNERMIVEAIEKIEKRMFA